MKNFDMDFRPTEGRINWFMDFKGYIPSNRDIPRFELSGRGTRVASA